MIPRTPHLSAFLLPLLVLLACWMGAPAMADEDAATAGERLAALEAEYLEVADGFDDRAYAEQRRILMAIADLRTPAAQGVLRTWLQDYGAKGGRPRAVHLASALVKHGAPVDVDEAIRAVERRHDPVLIEALGSILAVMERPAALAHLAGPALQRGTPPVKAQIARALGQLPEAEATLPLLALLRHPDLRVRAEAMSALGQRGEPKALPMLMAFARHQDLRMRLGAIRALGNLGDPKALRVIHSAFEDEASRVVEAAALAAGRIGSSLSCPPLIAGLKREVGKNLRVADAFARALHRISGKQIGPDPDLWASWWETVKDQPFVRVDSVADGGTAAGGPRYYGFPVRSSYVVFVLDVSRSMGWNERLDTAKKELAKTIEHLPERTWFNILVYSDEVKSWRSELTPATDSWKKRAARFVKAQRPINGTNSHDALQRAFADDRVDTVFFLTDGHPSVGPVVDPDLLLATVRGWNRFRDIRIHTIALMRGVPPPLYAGREDPDRATRFMEELASDNGGRFELVR